MSLAEALRNPPNRASALFGPQAPRILTLDIETSPNLADVWGLYDQNIGLNQVHKFGRVICFAAKWYDKSAIMFYSEYHHTAQAMLEQAHELLNTADIVVHYNGVSFDMKHLNREFLLAKLGPTAPYKQVDLMREVKRNFRFASNKLDHIANQVGIGSKVHHAGHPLWMACLGDDEDLKARAWRKMKQYNRGDVRLTEQLYDELRPWINHPHVGIWTGDPQSCGRCGCTKFTEDGTVPALLGRYPRLRCDWCGSYSRSNERSRGVVLRGVA